MIKKGIDFFHLFLTDLDLKITVSNTKILKQLKDGSNKRKWQTQPFNSSANECLLRCYFIYWNSYDIWGVKCIGKSLPSIFSLLSSINSIMMILILITANLYYVDTSELYKSTIANVYIYFSLFVKIFWAI